MMPARLPDASLLARISAARWGALGDRLRAAGYDAEYAAEVLARGSRYLPPLATPLHAWHLRRRDEPAARAMRVFGIGDPVTEGEARALVGDELFAPLVDAGLLVRADDGFVSAYAVTPMGGAYAVHDRAPLAEDAVLAPRLALDPVCGVAAGQKRRGRAIQLRAGSAAWAIALAPHVEQVVAVDASVRAVALARAATALNRADNVDVREGEGYAAAASEAFDAVVAMPPCVAMPEGAAPRAHLYGGARGDEATMALLASIPRRLAPGGRAVVVADLPLIDRERPLVARVRSALDEGKARALLLTSAIDLDEHCAHVAMRESPSLGAELAQALTALRSHYAKLRATGMSRAVVVVEPASSGVKYVVAQPIRAPSRFAPLTAAAVDALFAAHDLLARGKRELLAATLRFTEGAAFSAADGGRIETRFEGERLLEPMTVSAALYAIAQSVDAAPTVADGLAAHARGAKMPAAGAIEKLLPEVERALRQSLLEVATPS